MQMNEDALISLPEAQKLTGKSKNTLQQWRVGFYYKNGNEQIYYFHDKRRLHATLVKRVWWFKLKEVLEWNEIMNDRLGAWRRSK